MTESRKTEKTHRQMTWTRLSDTSKENENAGIYENTSSIEVLQKILPKQSLSILEMILKAYDNDLVRTTESLMLENGMLRFLTPPVSPEDSTSPSVFVTSDSEQPPSDARLSPFSLVSSTMVPYSCPVLPPTLPSHVIPLLRSLLAQ